MPDTEVDNDDIVERLGRIFKDMPPYTPCPVPEYSAVRPPNKVGNSTCVFEYSLHCSSRAPLLDLWIFQRRARARAKSAVKSARVTTPSP
jgi:hypothetical protein